jgi:HlyD family secretion protein
VDPGQTVASVFATPVLFTVAADLRKMEVLAAVDEADVAEVAVGQPAEFSVTAWPDRTFRGQVTEVRTAAKVVQDVVTYGAVVAVDNLDEALRPGMTAAVRVRVGGVPDALQVPNAALAFTPPGEARGSAPQVWQLEAGRLVARPVRTGLSDGELTAVEAAGLSVGEAVLVFQPV